MVYKDRKIPLMRIEGFNRMYALVIDIIAGNCLVEMQSCKWGLIILRPVTQIRNVRLFEDCDRGVVTKAVSTCQAEEFGAGTKNFQWRA